MKRLCLLIFSLIFFYGSSLAQVPKSGDIDGETWTADTLYLIIDNIKVIDLTIEPGVIIQFEDNYKFEVDGTLRADGFHSDSIYFQPHPDNSAGWEGIKFKNSSTASSLKYCRIEGSSKHGIDIDQVQPEVSNCRVVSSAESGIFLKGTSLQLQHCIIRNNAQSGIETDDSQVTVVNSIISENGDSGILSINNNDIINVTNVVIADNQDRGIDCPGGNLTVRNSIIYYNTIQIDSQDGNTDVTYSDVQGASEYPGEGNINTTPDFLERYYYTLSPQSPRSECIDAGNPNFAYTDIFSPPSLGTSRNDMGAYGGPQAFGWYPPLYIKPQYYDFNRVTQDSSKTTVLNILNYRDADITVSEILFDDDDDVFSNDPNSFSVDILDSVDLAVTFTPEGEIGYISDLILDTQSHGTVSIPISGEGVLPHIDLPSSELNFGPVNLGEDRQLELPVMNLGRDTLHVQVTTPSVSNFTLDKNQFAINPDSGTETITITFSPDSPITYTDSILILSNDRDNPEIEVSLGGVGLGPVIELDQQTFDFDSVAVLSDSIQILNIRNNGNDTLRINNLTIEPSNSGFSYSEKPIIFPLLVEPGSSFDLPIQFNPLERGQTSAQLSIYSNDPYQNLLIVDLSGIGLAPLLLLSSSEIQFDSVPLTSDSTINLTVFNLGNDLLYIDTLFISPSDDVFTITDTTISFPFILETENNITFPVRFKPVERGIRNGQITLISNDPFQDTILIDLIGEGTAPGLNVSTYALNFGLVPINSNSVLNLYIYNTIETGLTVDSIVIDPDNSVFEFADPTLVFPQVIDSEDSLVVPVRFRPDQEDSVSADLRIFSDDPLQKELNVQLSGRGVDTSAKPFIVLSSNFLEFDEVDTISYSQKNLYIYNIGDTDLIIPEDSIYIIESPDEAFSIINAPQEFRVSSQDSLEIFIRFEPSDLGPLQNILQINSNDPQNPQMQVTLSGTGIRPMLPEIKLSTDVLEFNEVDTSTFDQKVLSIYNIGNTILNIPEDSIFISASIHDAFSIINVSQDISINPNDSLDLIIRFQPSEIGPIQDTLIIKSNDHLNPEVEIILSGTGVSTGLLPKIELSTDVLEYNQVDTSNYADQSLFIHNTGEAILIIPMGSIYITDSAYDAFSIRNISSQIRIAPLDSQEVLIRFAPPEYGPDQANLWIKSNDPENPTLIVLLSGIGVGNGASAISSDELNTTNPFVNRQPVVIGFKIESTVPIDSATVYVTKGGEISYTPFSLIRQQGSSLWKTEIDSNYITEQGVEYYVLVHQGQTLSEYPENGLENPLVKTVQIPSMNFPESLPAKTYQMISIPFSTSGQDLNDLFQDNLGPYNKNNYRIFECSNGSTYSEISDMDKPLPPGQSIWLISKSAVNLDIHDGESVLTDTTYNIELKKGWNMISTPFAFPVSWLHLNTNLAIRFYDGTDWPFVAFMEPFKGYAVNSPSDTIIAIQPEKAILSKSIPRSVSGIMEDSWHIQISVSDGKLKDHYNFAGTLDLASEGMDPYDFAEPPPVGDYISLYLVSKDNKKPLSTDYRHPEEEGYIFDFEMKSNVNTKKSIEFLSDNLPDSYDWTIISEQTKVNFGKKSLETSSKEINYQLVVGTAEYLNDIKSEYKSVPESYTLAQNYPNPFNPTTIINFDLPITIYVELTIYNLLGQRVVTLLSGRQEAGYHQVEWDASGFASGVYYYRIKAGEFQAVKKMILLQ